MYGVIISYPISGLLILRLIVKNIIKPPSTSSTLLIVVVLFEMSVSVRNSHIPKMINNGNIVRNNNDDSISRELTIKAT